MRYPINTLTFIVKYNYPVKTTSHIKYPLKYLMTKMDNPSHFTHTEISFINRIKQSKKVQYNKRGQKVEQTVVTSEFTLR